MHPSGIITLLTDFGTSQPFVGVMKGAILSQFAQAKLVDLTHTIAPQAIDEAAFWVERCYRWFPPGTVHLVVVDPGVGSVRGMVALSADEHYFVGPDNGVFSRVWQNVATRQARRIDPQALGLSVPSATFHGRDVFGPVAAWIAAGRLAFETLPAVAEPFLRPTASAERTSSGIEASVLTIDHYGNAFTNIGAELVAQGSWQIVVGQQVVGLWRTYSDVAPGECLALVNSFGVVEIAVRDGNAAKRLGLRRGDRILARPSAFSRAQP